MSRLTQRGQGGPVELFQTSADSSLATMVGTKFDSADGREFVLVQNGGTALVAGNLIQGPAKIGTTSDHQNLATSTAAIGATTVSVTLAGTLATANQYQGGYVVFNAGTGAGQTLKIKSHLAAASSAVLVLNLEDAIVVATLASDTKSCLVLNPYGSQNGTNVSTSGVVVCPTTLTGSVIGVSLYAIAASTSTVASYGLIQTKGPVAGLNQGNTAIGLDLMPSASVAGGMCTYVVATKTRVGVATQAGVDTEARLITIQL